MDIKKIVLLLSLIVFCSMPVLASNHYTFEHADEMFHSGRVDWQEYGPDAFNQAIKENKPIFLMLTAPSWCYWCHVYTSDDYVYHESIYPIINEKFVPIYVDADKRQDLTRQYLEGGWPSTTVMTPSRERLFGFSGPRPIEWMAANLNNAATFVSQQGFAQTVGEQYQRTASRVPTQSELDNVPNSFAGYILNTFDGEHGGFGTGQKFPQGRTLDYSLELYEQTNQDRWLNLVLTTLQHSYTNNDELETNYNLFDPIDGGFHRYGTARDWSPPHYEKMLYDNVRLLKTYHHLNALRPNDPLTEEVVQKTEQFVETNWYDDKRGGFYGNSDVHGEHEYFAKNPRPADKPRVEKTKYTDWNSEAILTYLYLYELTKSENYKEMAVQTLDFFSKEMVTEHGALHYYKEDGEKGVTGSLLDNAYLLLAFVEAYHVLGEEKYLDVAQQLAQYSLDNLYDWYGGGFIERHSQETDLYAPGEHIRLSQPVPENGVMALAMLKLYVSTNNTDYLNAGLTTLGRYINNVPGHDRGYYVVKASQYAAEHQLLSTYEQHKVHIQEVEKSKQEQFWGLQLTGQPTEFVQSNEGLPEFSAPLLIILLISFVAGVLSFLSPCTLPIVPAFVAQSLQASKRNIAGMTIFFVLGLVSFFTLIGMTASVLGSFLQNIGEGFFQLTGIVVIIIGILIALGKGIKSIPLNVRKPTSFVGSFTFGAVMGLAWTPCEGFILVALLFLASTADTIFTGGLSLFFYGLGLSLPLLLIGFYLHRIDKESLWWKMIHGKIIDVPFGQKKLHLHTTSLISGVLFIILGILIFSGLLFAFNQYVASSGLQKFLFGIEEWLLGFVR